jgi:transglutaminase-like putative cysteine protease
LGPIHANNTPALNVKFESLPPQFATDNGRVLLRGQTFSTYNTQSFEWVPPEHLRTNDPTTDMSDPSVPDAAKPTPVRPVIKQTTESLGDIHSRIYLAAGTIKRVSAKVVDQDEEGSLHPTPGEPLDRTELFTQAPVHARDLPPTVWAQHPKADRYVRQRCVVDDVAERIREKAHQVTNGCATALEKVQAIQKYLRDSKNFSYTLNLQELNAARDPMERFLLSDDARQRRGHCGYFATAFVTLCRFNDIPARLASGYSADYPRDAVEPVEIRFLKASAHCWGEVYFKGYGWVPFDPTPSASQEIASAPLPVLPTEVQPAAPMPKPAVPTEGVVESTWKTFIGFTGIEQRKYYTKIGEFVSGRATDATEVLSGGSSTGWIGGTIAWLAITGMVAWLIHAYRKRGGSRLPPGGYGGRRARAAVAFYNDLLQVLSRRGFVRRPGQTPREFAEYVVKRGGNAFSPVMTVTHIFETVRYGGDEINQEDFNSLQKSLDSLRELTFVLAPQGPKQ